MENWQVHRLVEKDDESGKERPLGGAIVKLPVATATGQLDELEITPIDVEQVKGEFWFRSYVCIRLADSRVWLDPEEVSTVIELLTVALKAAEQNVVTANLS